MPIVPGGQFSEVIEQLQTPQPPLPIAMLPWLDCRYLKTKTLQLILAELRAGCRPSSPIDANGRHNRERATGVIEAHLALREARDRELGGWCFSRG
jgi:hypothetical protein